MPRLSLLALLLTLLAASAHAGSCGPGGEPIGQQSALIQGLQRQLADHGFDPRSFDGVYGPSTGEAIRAYQRAARLRADGCPTQALLDHLSFASPRINAPARTATDQTAVVYEIQQELSRLGYYTGRADGTLGPKTRAALQTYWSRSGMVGQPYPDSRLLAQLKNEQVLNRR